MSTTQSVPNIEFYEPFMNSLFEIYVGRFLIVCGRPDKQRVQPEAKMVVITVNGAALRGRRVLPKVSGCLVQGVQTRADLLTSSNATRVRRVRNSEH